MTAQTEPRSKGNALKIVVGTALILIVAAVVYPMLRPGYSDGPKCFVLAKHQAAAVLQYGGDWDAMAPNRDHWADLSARYTSGNAVYRCPDLGEKATSDMYGFAFNSWLAGKRLDSLHDAVDVPLVYDSINFVKNASDPFISFPKGVRESEKNRRSLAYADGHANRVEVGAKLWRAP